MGNPGVGKTHLANAIGLEALKNGIQYCLFTQTHLSISLTGQKQMEAIIAFLKTRQDKSSDT